MKRTEARENAFLLLFEAAARKDDNAEEIFETAIAERELEADAYVRSVFFGVYQHLDEIDRAVDECLHGWKRSRLSLATIAITRLAGYEMFYVPDIPGRVSINEGIELSKKYDDEKAYAFVNGVLNALVVKSGKKAEK